VLVVTLRIHDSVLIGEDIEVVAADIGPGKVRLGIAAPRQLAIVRKKRDDQAGRADPVAGADPD